jgi:uncharacterized protein
MRRAYHSSGAGGTIRRWIRVVRQPHLTMNVLILASSRLEMPVRKRIGGGLLALLAPLALLACGQADAPRADTRPALEFDTTRVEVVTGLRSIPLRVELAETPDQRALGLMERTSLPEDAGMLFTYDEPQPGQAGFWMFRTRIPLDIAFLDPEGTIVAIRTMEPCASPDPRWCESYAPGVPYQYALEVNQGFFERQGVGIGDRVVLPRDG